MLESIIFPCAPEGRKALDRQGFGAGQWVDCGLGEGGGDLSGRPSGGAQVVGYRLALLVKALAGEAQKVGLVNAKLDEARRGSQPA